MRNFLAALVFVAAGIALALTGGRAGAQAGGAGGDAKDVDLTDAAIVRSPYNWLDDGDGGATTNNPGAYLRARFTGTAVSLLVNTSVNAPQKANNYPALAWRVDDRPWQRRQLAAGDTVIPLADDLSADVHEVEVVFVGVWWKDPRWQGDPPAASLSVKGLRLDPAGEFVKAEPRPRRAVVYGDSNSEGYEALARGVTVANQDAGQATPMLLGRALDAEVGVIAFAGQGNVGGGGGGVPPLNESWDKYWSGKSRLVNGKFDPQPDFIVNLHGQNDAKLSREQVAAQVAAWRAAAPLAKIILVSPADLRNVATLEAGAATDPDAFFVTTGEDLLGEKGKRGEGAFHNNNHMNVRAHARFAAAVAVAIGRETAPKPQ